MNERLEHPKSSFWNAEHHGPLESRLPSFVCDNPNDHGHFLPCTVMQRHHHKCWSVRRATPNCPTFRAGEWWHSQMTYHHDPVDHHFDVAGGSFWTTAGALCAVVPVAQRRCCRWSSGSLTWLCPQLGGTYLVNFAANLWQVSLEPSGASNLTIQGGWEERLFQERAHFSCEEEGVFSKTTYCLTAWQERKPLL